MNWERLRLFLEERTPDDTVTSLPNNPQPGQRINFLADSTNRIVWDLRYNASGGTYKWEFLGGGPLRHEIATDEALNTGTLGTGWVDLATVGPTITVPLAGEYDIHLGSQAYETAAFNYWSLGLKIGSATTEEWCVFRAAAANTWSGFDRRGAREVTPAGTVVKAQYKSSGGTIQFRYRFMFITPLRVG